MTPEDKKQFDFFVGKINNQEPFKFVRFGDGEWNILGEQRGAAEYDYNEEGESDLRRSLGGDYYYSTISEGKRDHYKIGAIPKKDWYNADVFVYASMSGELYPLVEALKKRRLVFVGAKSMRKIEKVLPYEKFVEVPPRNCYKSKERVKGELLQYGEPAVYCFCAGYLSNILIYELDIPGATMIDFGSLFDAFTGEPTRGYQSKMPQDIKNKNLTGNP